MLSQCLDSLCQLKSLRLWQNALGASVDTIAFKLDRLTALEELFLAENGIGDYGFEAIVMHLPKSLKIFGLERNGMSGTAKFDRTKLETIERLLTHRNCFPPLK